MLSFVRRVVLSEQPKSLINFPPFAAKSGHKKKLSIARSILVNSLPPSPLSCAFISKQKKKTKKKKQN